MKRVLRFELTQEAQDLDIEGDYYAADTEEGVQELFLLRDVSGTTAGGAHKVLWVTIEDEDPRT